MMSLKYNLCKWRGPCLIGILELLIGILELLIYRLIIFNKLGKTLDITFLFFISSFVFLGFPLHICWCCFHICVALFTFNIFIVSFANQIFSFYFFLTQKEKDLLLIGLLHKCPKSPGLQQVETNNQKIPH